MEEVNDVMIESKQLKCMFCGNQEFYKVYTKMNKKWMSILDMEIFSPEGTAYICKRCGFKQEFFRGI